ncbi:MAG: hypothetical protein IJX62_01240 [Clostridia bacterium]|nr:hypothetical protein [Clostridia bacterium]
MNEQSVDAIKEVREFLCGYQVCVDLLNLRRYERKRAKPFDEVAACEALLLGNEAYWRARMAEISALVGDMRNGREKLVLYYHYIRGESIERCADLLGFSRRTGYRVHQRGLFQISFLYQRKKKTICQDFSGLSC